MKKQKFYANGVEMLNNDFSTARRILLLGMQKYRGKLSNYGPYTAKKVTNNDEEIERFIIDDFEFIVVQYKAMRLSIESMNLSPEYLATSIWFQRIK
jgi:hypothetical protein